VWHTKTSVLTSSSRRWFRVEWLSHYTGHGRACSEAVGACSSRRLAVSGDEAGAGWPDNACALEGENFEVLRLLA